MGADDRVARRAGLGGVPIAFIAGDDPRVAVVLERMASLPILTVGGHGDFTRRLYTDDARRRFGINMSSVELAGRKVSAQMLGLARIVR